MPEGDPHLTGFYNVKLKRALALAMDFLARYALIPVGFREVLYESIKCSCTGNHMVNHDFFWLHYRLNGLVRK